MSHGPGRLIRTRADMSTAIENARRKWKDTGDPVWAYAEAALAWASDLSDIEPSIAAVFERQNDPTNRRSAT